MAAGEVIVGVRAADVVLAGTGEDQTLLGHRILTVDLRTPSPDAGMTLR